MYLATVYLQSHPALSLGMRSVLRPQSPSHVQLCDLMDCSPLGSLSVGFSRLEYRNAISYFTQYKGSQILADLRSKGQF